MLRTAGAAVRRWWRTHTMCVDALLGVGLILFGLASGWSSLVGPTNVVPDHGWWVLGVGAVITVTACAVRRRHAYWSWAAMSFLMVGLECANRLIDTQEVGGQYVQWLFGAAALFGIPITVGTVAALASPVVAWACAVVSTVAEVAADQIVTTSPGSVGDWVYFSAVYLLVNAIGALVGMNVRTQRERLSAVEERSARLALAREQTALLAAANERSRIAREMHDVVAHSLAVMITMADGAAAAVERNPAMAKEALEILSETGRSALADTRRLVGVLRDDPGASSDPATRTERAVAADGAQAPAPAAAPPRLTAPGLPDSPGPVQASVPARRSLFSHRSAASSAPTTTGSIPVVRDLPVPEFAPPGTVAPHEPTEEIVALRRRATDARNDRTTGDIPMAPAPEQSDLRVLVDRFRAAGVPVEYQWTGGSLPDDKGLQLTLFRIAQESMTNILRYAPTTRSVRVAVDRHTGTAVLVVDNDAAPGSTPVHGSGKGLIGMRERAAVYGGTVDAGPTQTGWRVRAVLRWDEDDEGTTPWQMPM